MRFRPLPLLLLLAAAGLSSAQVNDANSLYGIHWYRQVDPGTDYSGPTDVEAMAPGEELWVLEISHLDNSSPDPNPGVTGVQAAPWDRPDFFTFGAGGGHVGRITNASKGHSLVFRLQPNWGRNVPYFEGAGDPDNDPFTLANFAAQAQAAANTLKDTVRIWQVGNEVNISKIENLRWNTATQSYDIPWEPTPAQYAETYLAVRDAIHTVTPNTAPAQQIVLVQPVSPGNAANLGDGANKYMDGSEFLWRTIEAMTPAERAKIDGFALHGYAEPGGANFGAEGFMDSITEQLMVIDAWGLHDRPVFITEFNKHMPDAANAAIGAQFVQAAYQLLDAWNDGTGGAWPGVANHDVVGAMWFVYPAGGWTEYSLEHWKTLIASTDANQNPWYGFQSATTQNHTRGSLTGGGAVDHNALWWQDDFATLDTTGGPPDWKVEPVTGGSSAVASGAGQVRLLGNGSNGGVTLRTAGYVYGDFRAEVEFEITNSTRPAGSTNFAESNFDIRIREGSKGYSLTFFTDASDAARANRVILRRANEWTDIGAFNANIGITSGDRFRVDVLAEPTQLTMTIYKNDSTTPAVQWTVPDNAQRVGWLRAGTYNLAEARLDRFAIGGTGWSGTPTGPSAAEAWSLY